MQRKVFYLFTLIMLLIATTGGRSVIAQDGGKGPQKPAIPAPQKLQGQVDETNLSSSLLSGKPGKYMVELDATPTIRVYANALSAHAPQADAVASAKTQRQAIEAAQQRVEAALTAQAIGAKVIYRVQRVFNGIAVVVDPAKLDAIAHLQGVKAIHPIISKQRDNASSVPLINAPQVWESGLQFRGEGITIGVIDSGIDYTHTDFGGPGSGASNANYTNNDTTVLDPDITWFPGTKVVGGFDFVGDAYDANSANPAIFTPFPDPDPSDCLSDPATVGHGTHVAGTAAGYGVKADGSTYAGPYTSAADFNAMRIGPGAAPLARLVALRVFGCEGSSDVVTQAIDWAVDPNNDDDPSDHLDVINMSLGSSFGSPDDPDVIASDAAAAAGVIVVTSAGNETDTYYVNGSPGIATRAISTAASVDALDIMDGFEVTAAPGTIEGTYGSSNAVAYNWVSGPDVTGDLVYPLTNQGGCAAFPAGTFTGKIALLDWTHVGTASECGSVTRTGNAVAAGAIGVLLVYDLPVFDISITGSSVVPSTITTKGTGDLIKTALVTGTVTVKITDAHDASIKVVTPSIVDNLASFSSRGPSRNGSAMKPDITAPGLSTFSALDQSGNQGQSLGGTSMASPHVAGVMALLRQIHPTWTVEELKALVMNTAEHDLFTGENKSGDKYGVTRIGAGRVDALLASQSKVVAYVTGTPAEEGAVSVSFGAPEILASGTPPTLTKSVKVVNKGNTAVTYNLAYAPIVDMPGVTPTFSAASVIVPAHTASGDGVATFTVTMHFDPAAMKHPYDPALTLIQTDYRPWMSEENGYLTLTPASAGPTPLRLQVGAFPRLVSDMKANSSKLNVNAWTGSQLLTLSGIGVNTDPSASSPDPTEELSLVSAFELAYIDAAADVTGSDLNSDLHYVGVMTDYLSFAADPNQCTTPLALENCAAIYFGINTFGNWSTPNEVEFHVNFDFNNDGTTDAILLNLTFGSFGTDPEDTFISVLCNPNFSGCFLEYPLNIIPPNVLDTVPFNTSDMVMGVLTGDLIAKGLNPANGFDFTVTTFNRENADPVDENFSTPYSYDYTHPAIDATGGFIGAPGWPDLPYDGQTGVVPVALDFTNYKAKGSPDLLLLHHHNGTGEHAEVVDVVAAYLDYLPLVRR